jgi:hypothetical protein
MSDSPSGPPATAPAPETQSGYHWYHKVSALLFILFCLEVGLFLLIFPWTDKWDDNLFATFLSNSIPNWSQYWQSTYLRGAMSGVGLIDLYICFAEIFRLRRFSRH